MLILVLNPGSTSLKCAIFRDKEMLKGVAIQFKQNILQMDLDQRTEYCKKEIMSIITQCGFSEKDFDCVVARGGFLGKIESGAYRISDRMIKALNTKIMKTPQTIGIRIAFEMMKPFEKPCYIYDAVSADEWLPFTKLTGVKGVEKTVAQHTLNSKSVAIKIAALLGKYFENSNLIVSHLGGGFDTTFFKDGRIIESLGYNDLGFSPERCGALQFDDLLDLAETMTKEDLRALNHGKGGLMSYFSTSDMKKVQEMAENGDEEAKTVLTAMFYRVAQLIGCGAVALSGDVDAIVLTGGGAHSDLFCSWIKERVGFIAPVYIEPGELELEALAYGALRVLEGKEEAKEYILREDK